MNMILDGFLFKVVFVEVIFILILFVCFWMFFNIIVIWNFGDGVSII